MKASVPRRPKRLPVFAIILVSAAAGYVFAITTADPWRQRGKKLLADERFACHLRPVLLERTLEAADGGPFHPQLRVAPVLPRIGIARSEL